LRILLFVTSQAIPKWKKYWRLLQKKDAKEPEEVRAKLNFERTFLKNMIAKYLHILYQIQVTLFPRGTSSVTYFSLLKRERERERRKKNNRSESSVQKISHCTEYETPREGARELYRVQGNAFFNHMKRAITLQSVETHPVDLKICFVG
jgi:hypothetical protein